MCAAQRRGGGSCTPGKALKSGFCHRWVVCLWADSNISYSLSFLVYKVVSIIVTALLRGGRGQTPWEEQASYQLGCSEQGGGLAVSLFPSPSALSCPFSNHHPQLPHMMVPTCGGDHPLPHRTGRMALLKYHILRAVLRVTGSKTQRVPGKASSPWVLNNATFSPLSPLLPCGPSQMSKLTSKAQRSSLASLMPEPHRVGDAFWVGWGGSQAGCYPWSLLSFSLLASFPARRACKDGCSGYKTKSLLFLSLPRWRSRGNQLIREALAEWWSRLGQ